MRRSKKTRMPVLHVLFAMAIALVGVCVHPDAKMSSDIASSETVLFEIRVHLFELDQNLFSAYNERLVSSRDMGVVKDMRADLLSRADVKLMDKAIIAVENNERRTYRQVTEVIYPEEVDAMGKMPDGVKWIKRDVGSTITVTPAYDEQSDCVSLLFDAEYVDEPEWVNGLPLFKMSSVKTKNDLSFGSVCMLPAGMYRDKSGREKAKVYFVEVRRLGSDKLMLPPVS